MGANSLLVVMMHKIYFELISTRPISTNDMYRTKADQKILFKYMYYVIHMVANDDRLSIELSLLVKTRYEALAARALYDEYFPNVFLSSISMVTSKYSRSQDSLHFNLSTSTSGYSDMGIRKIFCAPIIVQNSEHWWCGVFEKGNHVRRSIDLD